MIHIRFYNTNCMLNRLSISKEHVNKHKFFLELTSPNALSWPSPTTCKASSIVPVEPPINNTYIYLNRNGYMYINIYTTNIDHNGNSSFPSRCQVRQQWHFFCE